MLMSRDTRGTAVSFRRMSLDLKLRTQSGNSTSRQLPLAVSTDLIFMVAAGVVVTMRARGQASATWLACCEARQ